METRDDGSSVKCNPHPDAPHGFLRNASHNAGRYVCECEFWEPPNREWVGLTDEEIDAAWRSVDYTVLYEQFRIDIAHAIEAKLKDKNHG